MDLRNFAREEKTTTIRSMANSTRPGSQGFVITAIRHAHFFLCLPSESRLFAVFTRIEFALLLRHKASRLVYTWLIMPAFHDV